MPFLMRALAFVLILAGATSCSTPSCPQTAVDPAVEQLIDQLTQIDAQAPGLESTALTSVFIAEDTPPRFAGGVWGSPRPKIFSPMQALVRQGIVVLPALINHLDDKRQTKLTIASRFFTYAYYGDDYDPKDHSQAPKDPNFKRAADDKYQIPGRKYTVRVGDVCYALIGQIVNRQLLPVCYIPSQIFEINSPIETPALITKVKNDWGHIDSKEYLALLLADASNEPDPWGEAPALQRLRFYYPKDYERQKTGSLSNNIARFESANASKTVKQTSSTKN